MLLCLQYNNWFTFSEYEEPVTVRSCRPIHARELAMVGIGSFASIICSVSHANVDDSFLEFYSIALGLC